MKSINETVKKVYGNYPERVLQFGEGNFLRAFVDWMIDEANQREDYQGSIVLCQPIEPNGPLKRIINEQDGMYSVVMRGMEEGERVEKSKVITSVSRCINAYEDYDELEKIFCSEELEVIVSNTTEAGIVYKEGDKITDRPAASFPAKITQLLYRRFIQFEGNDSKGLLFLPVELIDNNGTELKRIILQYAKEWKLESSFIQWIDRANKFTNTLVDRIVTGYPKDELEYFAKKLGFQDQTIVTSEVFNLWVIEGKKQWADILPIHKGEANVLWTDDVKPYKMRKVRILNGGHTSTVLAAFLAGHDIVLDFMNDQVFFDYLQDLLMEEVIPTLELEKEELQLFAQAVMERFANPYIKHSLLDISLNSMAKFKARCLPSLLGYMEEKQKLPGKLVFSLAALIRFYKGTWNHGVFEGTRKDGSVYPIRDDKEVLDFYDKVWKQETVEVAEQVLSNKKFWGLDLSKCSGLTKEVTEYLCRMEQEDVRNLVAALL